MTQVLRATDALRLDHRLRMALDDSQIKCLLPAVFYYLHCTDNDVFFEAIPAVQRTGKQNIMKWLICLRRLVPNSMNFILLARS